MCACKEDCLPRLLLLGVARLILGIEMELRRPVRCEDPERLKKMQWVPSPIKGEGYLARK